MADPKQPTILALLGGAVRSALERVRGGGGTLAGAPSDVEDARPLHQQYLYTGLQSPEGVADIFRYADEGYLYRAHDFFEEQRNRDLHLATVLYRRENALSTAPWQIVPASDRPRDLRIAAWLEDALKRMGDVEHPKARAAGLDPRPLTDLVSHLNGAPIYGFAFAEILYVKSGARVVPAGALPIAPRRFVYSQLDASLRWWDATGPAHNYPGVDLLRDYAQGRFVGHRPRVNGAVGPREGLLRPLTWASLFRTWALGDWLKLAELAWKPYRWGTYDQAAGAGQDDIRALDAALQRLISRGWARIPKRTELHFEYAKGTASSAAGQHEALIRFLGEEMTKATLGHSLAVEEGRKGTARTATMSEGVTHQILEIDARAQEGSLQRHLCNPLVRFNFGKVPVPRFVFVTELGADIEKVSMAVARLVKDAGMRGVSEKWARSLLGAPEPDEGEQVLGGGTWTTAAAPAEAPSEPDGAEGGPDPQDVSEGDVVRMLRNYRTDQLLVRAGLRKAV